MLFRSVVRTNGPPILGFPILAVAVSALFLSATFSFSCAKYQYSPAPVSANTAAAFSVKGCEESSQLAMRKGGRGTDADGGFGALGGLLGGIGGGGGRGRGLGGVGSESGEGRGGEVPGEGARGS